MLQPQCVNSELSRNTLILGYCCIFRDKNRLSALVATGRLSALHENLQAQALLTDLGHFPWAYPPLVDELRFVVVCMVVGTSLLH